MYETGMIRIYILSCRLVLGLVHVLFLVILILARRVTPEESHFVANELLEFAGVEGLIPPLNIPRPRRVVEQGRFVVVPHGWIASPEAHEITVSYYGGQRVGQVCRVL